MHKKCLRYCINALKDIAFNVYIYVQFAILFHILAKNPDQNVFLVKCLAKIWFSYTFVQKTKFIDFCEGACHYDAIEAKRWAC